MNRPVSRPNPVGPVQAYRTYAVLPDRRTAPRRATCEEFGCLNWRNGFAVPIPAGPEGERRRQILKASRRSYTLRTKEDGTILAIFPPGTTCFAVETHRVQTSELFVVRGGDWRGNPTGYRRVHQRPADWVEDCSIHLDKIATEARRG